MNEAVSPPLIRTKQAAWSYLRDISRRPAKRPMGSHSSAFLRSLGLIDDEVLTPDKRRITASEAIEEFGEGWYLSTQFTGRERVTPKGRDELAKHRKRV